MIRDSLNSFDYENKDSTLAALLPKPKVEVFGHTRFGGRGTYTASGKKIEDASESRIGGDTGGTALKHVSFKVPKGKVCAIIGRILSF